VVNPDINSIITSPEAERMRRMATKGFYDKSRLGLWLYEAIGREWDEMGEWARGLRHEIFPQACTWSIGIWESAYGFEPGDAMPLERRRQRILAKIQSRPPINPEAIRRGVEAFTGDWARVTENVAPHTFDVAVQSTRAQFAEVRKYIRDIKPAHLAFTLGYEPKAGGCAAYAGIAAAGIAIRITVEVRIYGMG
jgi:hypothetical protein